MTTTVFRPSVLAFIGAMAFAVSSVHATSCTGISVGTASTADVTFAGMASDQCVVSKVNPQQGPDGNSSGFASAFGPGAWSLLGKVSGGTGSALVNGVTFAWTFAQQSGTSGTWSVTTDKDASFDLVFAMHAGNRSGAFFFDDLTTVANHINANTWTINWLNGGGQVPDFSNLTIFERNVAQLPTAIPEPATYALMLSSLAVMGFVVRRRKMR